MKIYECPVCHEMWDTNKHGDLIPGMLPNAGAWYSDDNSDCPACSDRWEWVD